MSPCSSMPSLVASTNGPLVERDGHGIGMRSGGLRLCTVVEQIGFREPGTAFSAGCAVRMSAAARARFRLKTVSEFRVAGRDLAVGSDLESAQLEGSP